MEKKLVIYFVVTALVFAVLGGVAGFAILKLLPSQKVAEKAAGLVLSKTISSITVYGTVESINGKNIVLTREGEKIAVFLPDNIPIYALSSTGQEKADFKAIKAGDNISVGVKMNAQRQLEGQSVMIFKKGI